MKPKLSTKGRTREPFFQALRAVLSKVGWSAHVPAEALDVRAGEPQGAIIGTRAFVEAVCEVLSEGGGSSQDALQAQLSEAKAELERFKAWRNGTLAERDAAMKLADELRALLTQAREALAEIAEPKPGMGTPWQQVVARDALTALDESGLIAKGEK